MIRKLILALTILALTTTPALARRGGGGFHSMPFWANGDPIQLA